MLQDEVAVKRKLGRIDNEVLCPGANGHNPFSTKSFRTKPIHSCTALGFVAARDDG